MKQFPKEYENVFKSKRSLKCCRFDLLGNDMGIDTEEYIHLLQSEFASFEKAIFDHLVKVVWLVRRFCYRGKNRSKPRGNGWVIERAYGVFMRNFVGFNHTLLTANFLAVIASYFEEFFPDFHARNPFEEKMEFPFHHISFGHLVMVYQMPERIELLQHAEKMRMDFGDFVEYVINYVSCFNEREKRDIYVLNFNYYLGGVPYVRYRDKKI